MQVDAMEYASKISLEEEAAQRQKELICVLSRTNAAIPSPLENVCRSGKVKEEAWWRVGER